MTSATTFFPRGCCLLPALALLLTLSTSESAAGVPRVLPAGQAPADIRLQPPKDLDGYFPFRVPASREEWERRAERVRRQLRVTLGLWPEPTRTPLNAVIHGRLARDGYTVEKVFFESSPGFFVTGNLYRPAQGQGPFPGVLCPHGHWPDGRFMDAGVDEVRKQIAAGGERFEEGGRSPLQARCVQLARMGCVVFHYDMIGYADSVQIPSSLSHGFSKQRPEMSTAENWGLFSPQAEARFQSVMGLQTWNSIRSLDFLLSLPEVDAERIGCTGASGGGTQTFILSALDARVKAAFPAVMVGTAMQGGCTCENACGLRVETGNVEFAGLFAPKPLGMTSADDWTREMSTKGLPELKQLYALLGAPDAVSLKRGEHFGHNYNHVSRTAMYGFINRTFKLGLPEPVLERDYPRLSRAEMSVWDDQHPTPPGGPDFERKLLKWWTAETEHRVQEALAKAETFRQLAAPAAHIVVGRNLDEVGPVQAQPGASREAAAWTETAVLVKAVAHQEEIPAVVLKPKKASGRLVVWVEESGKAGLYTEAGDVPRPEVQRLLEAGSTVIGADLLFQGEFLTDGQAVAKTRRVKNPREAAAYTFGYNHTLFAQRVHDVLTLVVFARQQEGCQSVDLAGWAGAGPWVAAARAVAGNALDRTIVETKGFRFGAITEIHDVGFLPGGAKFDDLPGLLKLGAPGALWVTGEPAEAEAGLRAYYQVAGVADKLKIDDGAEAGKRDRACQWLTAAR